MTQENKDKRDIEMRKFHLDGFKEFLKDYDETKRELDLYRKIYNEYKKKYEEIEMTLDDKRRYQKHFEEKNKEIQKLKDELNQVRQKLTLYEDIDMDKLIEAVKSFYKLLIHIHDISNVENSLKRFGLDKLDDICKGKMQRQK